MTCERHPALRQSVVSLSLGVGGRDLPDVEASGLRSQGSSSVARDEEQARWSLGGCRKCAVDDLSIAIRETRVPDGVGGDHQMNVGTFDAATGYEPLCADLNRPSVQSGEHGIDLSKGAPSETPRRLILDPPIGPWVRVPW